MRIPIQAGDRNLMNSKNQKNEKTQGDKNDLNTEAQRNGNDAEANFPHYKRVSDYLLGTCIGEGSFAKVRIGMHCPTQDKVAIKIINKAKAKKDSYVFRNLHREGKILQMSRHPNIIQVYDILETGNNYYLVTELCTGGELIDIVTEKGHLSEPTVQKYTFQLCDAVAYLHDQKIIHRDLKVENLLLDRQDNIKIIDFGLSNTLPQVYSDISCCLFTQCGSPAYAAPELLAKRSYGPKVDVWSIGVITFALLVGKLPFTVEPFSIPKLCRKMMRGEMNALPTFISTHCRFFIRKLLCSDVANRPTVTEVLKLKWLSSCKSVFASRNNKTSPKNTKSSLYIERFSSDALSHRRLHNQLSTQTVDTSIVQEMGKKFGFSCSDVIQCINKNRPGPALATYHLLAKRKRESERKKETKTSKNISEHIKNKLSDEDGSKDSPKKTEVGRKEKTDSPTYGLVVAKTTTPPSSESNTPIQRIRATRNKKPLSCEIDHSNRTVIIPSPTASPPPYKEKLITPPPVLPKRRLTPVELSAKLPSRNVTPSDVSNFPQIKPLEPPKQPDIKDLIETMNRARSVLQRRTRAQSNGHPETGTKPGFGSDNSLALNGRKSPQIARVDRKTPVQVLVNHKTPDKAPVSNFGSHYFPPSPPRSPRSRPSSHRSPRLAPGNVFAHRRSVYTPNSPREQPRYTPDWLKGHQDLASDASRFETPPGTPGNSLNVPKTLPAIVPKATPVLATQNVDVIEARKMFRRSLPISTDNDVTLNRDVILEKGKKSHQNKIADLSSTKRMFVNKSRYGYYVSNKHDTGKSSSQPQDQRPRRIISEPIAAAISYLTSTKNRGLRRDKVSKAL